MSIEATAKVLAKWVNLQNPKSRFIKIKTKLTPLISEMESEHQVFEYLDFMVYEAFDGKKKFHIIYSISRSDDV